MRPTPVRCAVYAILEASGGPLCASQILDELDRSGRSFDLVTVYRTLNSFEHTEVVTRMDRTKEGWRYALRSRSHVHSITCSQCGAVTQLASCDLETLDRIVAETTGFSHISHMLQFRGVCPTCTGGTHRPQRHEQS